MDFIKELLKIIFKLAFSLVVLAIVWFLLVSFFPKLEAKSFFKNVFNGEWLPEPGSFGGLLQLPKQTENTNVHVHSEPFKGYGETISSVYYSSSTEYLAYNNGRRYVNPVSTPPNNQSIKNSPHIRNISIYENGSIYNGISFTGEANVNMFKNGQFPILVVENSTQKVIGAYPAYQVSQKDSTGFARFQVKINSNLPNKTSCLLVFQSGDFESSRLSVRVMFPVVCG